MVCKELPTPPHLQGSPCSQACWGPLSVPPALPCPAPPCPALPCPACRGKAILSARHLALCSGSRRLIPALAPALSSVWKALPLGLPKPTLLLFQLWFLQASSSEKPGLLSSWSFPRLSTQTSPVTASWREGLRVLASLICLAFPLWRMRPL